VTAWDVALASAPDDGAAPSVAGGRSAIAVLRGGGDHRGDRLGLTRTLVIELAR